jgi:hypothetical protein
MATILYTLGLSRHVRGMVKGPVPAVPAAIAGHLMNGDIVRPDVDAVRNCLPACYRKAFDRAGGTFWFSSENEAPAYMTLHDTRGRYLNTLYAQPYTFGA